MEPERFVLNVRNGRIHDTDSLKETCNTDDAIQRRYFASLTAADEWLRAQGRRPARRCRWCLGG